MSSDFAIRVSNVTKTYQIYDKPLDRLKQTLWRGRNKFYKEFKALDGVSFNIREGETVGVIGRNGSGKSTILQLICGTLTPTLGEVEVNGRVAALLELGAGFNPEFSGRENVYMNAAILGLTKEQTDKKFESIESFADIGAFIDQPVKTYSSGMYVRLAFSVAINVSPDVLIIDEALAVGDAAFQYKCIKKMESLRDSGVTIFLVSHDIATIKRFCDRAIWIHNGKVVDDGESTRVADEYQSYIRGEEGSFEEGGGDSIEECKGAERIDSNGGFGRISEVVLLDRSERFSSQFVYGDDILVRIYYELEKSVDTDLVLGCAIFRNDGLYVCGLNTGLDKVILNSNEGRHCMELRFRNISLLSGQYQLTLGIFDSRGLVASDALHGVGGFVVSSPYVGEGVYIAEHEWMKINE